MKKKKSNTVHTHILEDGTAVTHTHEAHHEHSSGTEVHEHDHGHTHTHTHENTKAVLNRLSRAIGHLESIRRMVEDGRDCSDDSAFSGQVCNQQYRKSDPSGSHSALSGGCDRIRGYGDNRRIK